MFCQNLHLNYKKEQFSCTYEKIIFEIILISILQKKRKKGVLSSNEVGINKDEIRFWYVQVLHLTVSCFG